MTGGFYADGSKLDYPTADRLVVRYLDVMAVRRTQTTTVDVLKWSEYPNTAHNRRRVFDALEDLAELTDEHRSGRRVFALPDNDQQ